MARGNMGHVAFRSWERNAIKTLSEALAAREMTHDDVAEKLSCSRVNVGYILRGMSRMKLAIFLELCALAMLPPGELLMSSVPPECSGRAGDGNKKRGEKRPATTGKKRVRKKKGKATADPVEKDQGEKKESNP